MINVIVPFCGGFFSWIRAIKGMRVRKTQSRARAWARGRLSHVHPRCFLFHAVGGANYLPQVTAATGGATGSKVRRQCGPRARACWSLQLAFARTCAVQPARNTNRATRARSSTAARAPSARVRRDARAAASLDRAANNRRRSHQQPAANSRDRSSLGNVSEAGVQETPVRACRRCRACPPHSACAVLDTGRVHDVHVQVRRAAAVVNQEKVAKEVGACPPRFCRTRRACACACVRAQMQTRRRCCGPCHLAPTHLAPLHATEELTRLDGSLAARCALLCACSARSGREPQQMRHRGRQVWRRRRRLRLCWSCCGRQGRPWCGPYHLGPIAYLPDACTRRLIGRRRCRTHEVKPIAPLGRHPAAYVPSFPYPCGVERLVLEIFKIVERIKDVNRMKT